MRKINQVQFVSRRDGKTINWYQIPIDKAAVLYTSMRDMGYKVSVLSGYPSLVRGG